jgi:hypothetical protein
MVYVKSNPYADPSRIRYALVRISTSTSSRMRTSQIPLGITYCLQMSSNIRIALSFYSFYLTYPPPKNSYYFNLAFPKKKKTLDEKSSESLLFYLYLTLAV